MPVQPSSITTVEQQALSTLVAGARVVSLLSPGGATNAAVGDILAAAGSAIQFVNTANAALSILTTPIKDPIGTSFSTGQPYGGTFITSPTVTQLTPVNFSQSLNATTQALSLLSLAQQVALAAQTGITLLTDADLAIAMAVVFSQTQANFKLAFSIDLTNSASFTPIPYATIPIVDTTITILPLTASPDMTALSDFITQVAISFPNVVGIAGVAASIWVGGLGVAVDASGVDILGIPSTISTGSYGDIITAAGGLVSGLAPVTIVDYSFQQNQFNLVTALAIDHGLSGTLTSLMGSSMVTDVTRQVIKNRLASVSQRGDALTLSVMFTILGVNNIPDAPGILTNLLTNLQPSDQTTTGKSPTVVSSGIVLATATPTYTTSQLITYINSMLTQIGTTINTLCSQNTCNSIFCSLPLLNVAMMRKINQTILTELLSSSVVEMAYMF